MFKKFSTLAILLTLFVSLVGCKQNNTASQENNSDVLITLVLDKGGVNDESFNQLAWEGAKEASKEYGVKIKYLESNSDADYKSNLEQAVDMDSDLIIAVGFNLSEAVKEVATSYNESKFAIIDGSFDEIPENVTVVSFDEAESGYLAGLVSAKNSNSNEFGFIGGMNVPAVQNYQKGFEKGLLEVNPNAKLSVQYANSFTDAAKGRAIATQMYNNNVDCIMTAGGGVNNGVYEVAMEMGKFAVAVDMAQNHISPSVILTSAIKKVDTGVKDTVKSYLDNTLKGGTINLYNIKNDGVGYEKTDLLSSDTIEFMNSKIKELKSK